MHYNGNVVIRIMTELGAGKKQRDGRTAQSKKSSSEKKHEILRLILLLPVLSRNGRKKMKMWQSEEKELLLENRLNGK